VARDRIVVLDILRGMALAGMILVHFHQTMEQPTQGLEDAIGWFIFVAVESKAWGIFAVLFGAGFAIFLRSVESRRQSVVAPYLRRLAGLAIFGVVAEGLFGFHVLLEYAIWGVPLLVVRRWRSSALLLLAALSVSAYSAVSLLNEAQRGSAVTATTPATTDERSAAYEALDAASKATDYPALVRARFHVMGLKYGSLTTYLPGHNFALFLIGLLAFRHGIFTTPLAHRNVLAAGMAFGGAAWAITWVEYLAGAYESASAAKMAALTAFGLLSGQWLCFTYIGATLWLLAAWPAWQGRLVLFAAAGRMALTNYLLQIAALDILASGYGFALRIRPIAHIVGTAALFGALAVFSRVWLSRFRLGPAEWLWRCVTYWCVQPIGRGT